MENQIAAEDVFAEMERDLASRSSQQFAEVSKALDPISKKWRPPSPKDAWILMKKSRRTGFASSGRSGYNPQAGEALLTRLLNTRYESNNQHYRRQSVQERLKLIKTKAARYIIPGCAL
jgi:hypothetical protein